MASLTAEERKGKAGYSKRPAFRAEFLNCDHDLIMYTGTGIGGRNHGRNFMCSYVRKGEKGLLEVRCPSGSNKFVCTLYLFYIIHLCCI